MTRTRVVVPTGEKEKRDTRQHTHASTEAAEKKKNVHRARARRFPHVDSRGSQKLITYLASLSGDGRSHGDVARYPSASGRPPVRPRPPFPKMIDVS